LAADPQRREEHAADRDLVLVAAELIEQRAHVFQSPVVDAPEALRDRLVAPGPVADREFDLQKTSRTRGGEREQPAQLGPGVPAIALDAFDHRVDAQPLPRVEHLVEQRTAVLKVPVEAALRDAERLRELLDSDSVRTADPKGT
jgi:hypothetical protein